MGWLDSIFRKKKKEPETVNVELKRLSEWFDERAEPLLESIKDDIKSKLKQINKTAEEARENSRILKSARLKNENIPDRAMQVMQGNRDAYIKAVSLFLDQLKTPSSVTIGSINDFLTRFEENLDHFTKTSSRSYYVLQEFFGKESGVIAQNIKRIDAIARSLLDNDYRKINSIREKIGEIDDFLEMRKNAADQIEDEMANYNSIKAAYQETQDRIDKIEQSRDYRELRELEKEKKGVEEQIKANEEGLKNLLSPLEKSMKKYSKMAAEGEHLLNDYLESPVEALLKDSSLRILEVLKKMKEAVSSGQLDLKEKKKEKTLEAIDSITSDRLNEYAAKHKELKDSLDKLKKRESINTAAQKLSELQYKLSHLKGQLDRSASQIEKLKKQMEKSDLREKLSEIENEVKDVLSVRLKVRWKNEDAQKTA